MLGQLFTKEQIEERWDEILPLLQKAIDSAEGELEAADVRRLLADGSMFLGVIRTFQSEEILLVLVGEVHNYPRKRVLNVAFVGGKPLVQSRAKHLYAALESIAKLLSCTTIQGMCKPGAARLYARTFGLKPTYMVLRREVTA